MGYENLIQNIHNVFIYRHIHRRFGQLIYISQRFRTGGRKYIQKDRHPLTVPLH